MENPSVSVMEAESRSDHSVSLIELIRTLPCLACGITPCDAHHVKTRGAGGQDTADNLMPLCREHHTLLHTIGYGRMTKKFPVIRNWLELANREDVLSRMR
jgi:hypothetical protein